MHSAVTLQCRGKIDGEVVGDFARFVLMNRGSRNLFRLSVSMSKSIGTIRKPWQISD